MLNEKNNSLFSRFRKAVLLTSSMLAMLSCAGNQEGTVLPDDPTQEEVSAEVPGNQQEETKPESPVTDPGSSTTAADLTEKQKILESYDHLDPKNVVPYKALEDAVLYFHKNKSRFKNQNYISVINFGQSSKEKRFYIINLKTGTVWAIRVAHGKGSDRDHDSYAERFSNTSGSNASSLGIYRAAETYYGKHGLSLRLDGLSSTNSRARSRAIVIHGASYVKESSVTQGRSWGCPAVTMDYRDAVIKYLKNGSLIYATVDKGGTKRPSVPAVPTVPEPGKDEQTIYKISPLSWESSEYPERKQWSQYVMKLVLEEYDSLLKGSDDIRDFCPSYYTLSNHDRANVWAQIVAAMTRYESNYRPTSRMKESTHDKDVITGQSVYSEGLLQLSYQDMTGYKFCKFDWSKDKHLSPTDPKKTILDPYINLHCGVGILARQIARKDELTVGSGAYWAVLKSSYSRNRIREITKMVKSLPMCQ